MRLYDTLTRRVRTLRPLQEGRATIYTCGPTVYRPVHLGNLRSFLLPDLVRRVLRSRGVDTHQVINITDVGHMTDEVYDRGEDKMLLAAADEGLSPGEVAAKYEAAFHRDAARLGLTPAQAYPKASGHIPEMIALIERLLRAGHAYEHAGTVYFDVATYPAYGALSGNRLDELRAGHRLDELDHHKRRPADFVLWKAAGPRRVVRFDSPWGEGYPGWHIECSAMSLAHLGEHVDLHTGGVDLVFPHHEGEIAQSEGAVGHPVVGHWLHGDHLLFSGRKMAKSAGNTWTLDRVEDEGFHPLDFRYLCLTGRYRRQLRFTVDALAAAATARRRLRGALEGWGTPAGGVGPEGKEWDARWRAAVADDLDFPKALTVVWALVNESSLARAERSALLTGWDDVLGLALSPDEEGLPPLPEGAADLLASRAQARAARDWAESDRLRAVLGALGVEVVDTPAGQTYRLHRPGPG